MFALLAFLLFRIHRLENQNTNDLQAGHSPITENTVIHDQIIESTDCQYGREANGGLYYIESPATSVNFTNCQFSHCFNVFITMSESYYGGVLYFSNIENTYISNTTFINCTSPSGGAVGLSNVSLAVFESTSFIQNSAIYYMFGYGYGNGGAIWFGETEGCSLIMNDCIFDSNTASAGAAVYVGPSLDELFVEDCLFIHNRDTNYNGAAIYAAKEIYTTPVKKVSILTSQFINNSIDKGSETHVGSACFIRAKDFTLKDCYFSQNKGINNVNCPVLALTITENKELLIDSCTCFNNSGSFAEIKGVYLDTVTIYNCNISNNHFYDKGVIYGDPLPQQLLFENSVFAGNDGTSCHALTIPPGNIRYTSLTNCIFDSIGVTSKGPTVLIESFTEIVNSSFINHAGSALSIQVSNAHVLIKSIIFHNNSCTDTLAGKDGFLCEGSNVSFVDADLTTSMIISSANAVSFENSTISRYGLQVTASYVYITSTTIFSLSKKENLILSASKNLIAKNITCNNNQNVYIQFNGQNNESKVEIIGSMFNNSPIEASNPGLVYVNNSQFIQCFGNLEGGALRIGDPTDSIYIYKCTFSECTSNSGLGGAIYANTNNNFILELSSFEKCKSSTYGSCLYLYGGLLSIINNCTFHNDDDSNSASIYIYDKSVYCQTIFVNGCFSSDAQKISADAHVHHIYSTSTGSVSFNYPMCFDRPKEDSVFFKNGQDADKGYDCYNCLDCGKMPVPGPSSIPSASSYPQTTLNPPTETPSPTETDDDSDSGKKKTKILLIAGIVVGVVVIIIIIIIIIIVVRRRNINPNIDSTQLVDPNIPIQLNTQENLPNSNT